jgi:hypothetical protein
VDPGEPSRPAPWPARLLPLCALIPPVVLALRRLAGHDLGFHLEAGNHVLGGNGWPSNDPFTFTVADHAYIDTSWGYQVMLALLERAFGPAGLVLFNAGLVLAAFVLLWATASLYRVRPLPLTLLLLLAGLVAEPRFQVRPELWSHLLLALLLYLLHRHRARGDLPLWTLVPLFLVWANSHSLFLLGWAVLACFVVGSFLQDRRLDRNLLKWSAVAVAVTLVNPYGWRAPLFALSLSTRMREANVFARNIGEFQSPLSQVVSEQLQFFLLSATSFFLLVLLALAVLLPLARERRYTCLLLTLIFLPLSLSMIRNTPLLALTCLPGMAWALSAIPRGGWNPRWAALRRIGGRAAVALVVLGSVALSLRVVSDAHYIGARRLDRFGLGWNHLALPLDFGAYADRVDLRGPGLNHLNFGGTLIWTRPDPVFIDGRLEVMGEEFFEDYREALDSPQGLEVCVARYGIRWVVFPYRLRPDLLLGLSGDPRWRLAYVDHLAALFLRDGPGAEALVDASVLQLTSSSQAPVELSRLPGLGGQPRASRLRRWLTGLWSRQDYPMRPFTAGLFHYSRHEARPAEIQFAEAIVRSAGAYPETYNNLGAVLLEQGRFEEAGECLEIYLSELPFYRLETRKATKERLRIR